MSTRWRQGLIERITQLRRVSAEPNRHATRSTSDPGQAELRALLRELEARITHVEQLTQGLQDSVHRDSTRQSKRIAELEARIDPTALHKALSENARQRGL